MKKFHLSLGALGAATVAVVATVSNLPASHAATATPAATPSVTAVALPADVANLVSPVGLELTSAPNSVLTSLAATAPTLDSIVADTHEAIALSSASLAYATDSSHLTTNDPAEMPAVNKRLSWVLAYNGVQIPLLGVKGPGAMQTGTMVVVVDAATGQFLESKLIGN